MAKDILHIRLELTPEQRAVVERATGRAAEALELSVAELDERIAPARLLRPSGGAIILDP
jgi:hypothetical protein